MNAGRTLEVARHELTRNFKRPLFWILLGIVALCSWGLSTGDMQISSGDSAVGGEKAFITSEFSFALILTILVGLFYSFFIAVLSGMVPIHDEELKVTELLHATPLEPREYVVGKISAIVATFAVVLFFHLVFAALFFYVIPNPEGAEFIGPFSIANFLRPALFLAAPFILFFIGTSFAVGSLFRRPILVFFLPVVYVLFSVFFLWDWAPTWLEPKLDRVLMLVDPVGFRWLNQTFLNVDRGVRFYNETPIPYDTLFVLSRLAFVAVGGLGLFWCHARLVRTVRGRTKAKLKATALPSPAKNEAVSPGLGAPLSSLRMNVRPPGALRGFFELFKVESKALLTQPGLYLFVPLILVQTVSINLVELGAFQTPLLHTPGGLAIGSMNTLTLLVCLLILFYTTESMLRERHTGLASIHFATPIRGLSFLLAKILANSLVALGVLLGAWLGCGIILLLEGCYVPTWQPFASVWGALLLPTFIVWSSFTALVLTITRNRYTTFAVGLGALILTGYCQQTGKMNWVGNWNIWGVALWTDMGAFQLDRLPLMLNRIMVLGASVLFLYLAVRIGPFQERDTIRTLHRFRPRPLLKSALLLIPFLIVPAGAGIKLYNEVEDGFQGSEQELVQKEYWRKNFATFRDHDPPSLAAVEFDMNLEPQERAFTLSGHYRLINDQEKAMASIPLTPGPHFEDLSWTLNGEAYEPEDRAGLKIFTIEGGLPVGGECEIGFSYSGRYPNGITSNGGGLSEFILPAGVVLTSFSASFLPVIGYDESIGVDEDNSYDSKEYPSDFYVGITDCAFGSSKRFTTKAKISAPEEYTVNSVGTLIEETVKDGRRTVVWESDHPVMATNVIAGRWEVRRGEGTALFYHPEHVFNVEEMIETLDASRKYYSEWFYPFPWNELRVSEFPGLAGYAQGFPTNISFSEQIGFLTESDEKSNAAFLVTAHEAAHQWWGNILVPGEAPGGNILSEGMAHFSTLLLQEQVHGLSARIEFAKRIEESYAENRQADSERPMVQIDGTRAGDTTVTYDKGGWVFWMLLISMGREANLKGIQHFIGMYDQNRDHPVLQDFVREMRPFTPDKEAYDRFVAQWFFEVVVPEYGLLNVEKTPLEQGRFKVSFSVENRGTAAMPLQIAAVRGVRFPTDDEGDSENEVEPYQEARITVAAGKETVELSLECDFEPERVIVDPDALVLQINRKFAVHEF